MTVLDKYSVQAAYFPFTYRFCCHCILVTKDHQLKRQDVRSYRVCLHNGCQFSTKLYILDTHLTISLKR